MHIRKYDKLYSRRHFLNQVSTGVIATGVLSPLWPTIARGNTIEKVYPDEISTLEGLTGGKINTGDVIDAHGSADRSDECRLTGAEFTAKRDDVAADEQACNHAAETLV